MSEVMLNAEQLKTLLKVAIVEILQEQKEVFTEDARGTPRNS